MNMQRPQDPPRRAPVGLSDADWAAVLLAVDPSGLGGVSLRARFGPAREHWLGRFRALLPGSAPVRKLPLNISEGGLLGGLDLTATLSAGRPVAERGLLAETDGGVVLVAMAERLPTVVAAHLAAVLDTKVVAAERDGLSQRLPARIGVVALDEGIEDECPPAALLDRLAFLVDLDADPETAMSTPAYSQSEVVRARTLLCVIQPDDAIVEAVCAAGMALGVDSIRAVQAAVKAACVAAALDGRCTVAPQDAALAARLVFAPRATRIPQVPEEAPSAPEETEDRSNEVAPPPEAGEDNVLEAPVPDRLPDEVIMAAAAAIPAGLLAQLRMQGDAPKRSAASGRAGAVVKGAGRGRPAGTRRGGPGSGARLNLIETLRAAAPWQGVRRSAVAASTAASVAAPSPRIDVRRDDWRVTRLKQRSESTTIFVVDASGSAALHRLAEAKGAVEHLLADCYVRRDRVAVIAFRGTTAELLLPPTRSLVRAKRSLSGLPGGGGTPLATALDAATGLAEAVRRKGQTPTIVLLTDGRANVTRNGSGGRAAAGAEAMAAARLNHIAGITTLLIDTSPRPSADAERLAMECGAQYLALPQADASVLSRSVRAATDADRDKDGARSRPGR